MDTNKHKPVRVLFVEDNPADVALISAFLTRNVNQNYQLTHCSDYDSACHHLKSEQFDVLLVDYFLERHTGLEILQFLNEGQIDTPAIILTGASDEQIAKECILAGATDFIQKDEMNSKLLYQTISHARVRAEAEQQKKKR